MNQTQTINEALANSTAAYQKYCSANMKRDSAVRDIAFIDDENLLTKEHAIKVKRADDALEAAYAVSLEADNQLKALLAKNEAMRRLFTAKETD